MSDLLNLLFILMGIVMIALGTFVSALLVVELVTGRYKRFIATDDSDDREGAAQDAK